MRCGGSHAAHRRSSGRQLDRWAPQVATAAPCDRCSSSPTPNWPVHPALYAKHLQLLGSNSAHLSHNCEPICRMPPVSTSDGGNRSSLPGLFATSHVWSPWHPISNNLRPRHRTLQHLALRSQPCLVGSVGSRGRVPRTKVADNTATATHHDSADRKYTSKRR